MANPGLPGQTLPTGLHAIKKKGHGLGTQAYGHLAGGYLGLCLGLRKSGRVESGRRKVRKAENGKAKRFCRVARGGAPGGAVPRGERERSGERSGRNGSGKSVLVRTAGGADRGEAV